MAGFAYRYELRRGDEVIASGRMTRQRALEIGERITLSGRLGVVQSIEPGLSERDLHMVIQPHASRSAARRPPAYPAGGTACGD